MKIPAKGRKPADTMPLSQIQNTANEDSKERLSRLRSELITHARALQQALEDQNAEAVQLYNVDFSVLYPFLLGTNRFGRARGGGDYDSVSLSVVDLLRRHCGKVNFRILISDPAFYELLDYLGHRVEHYEYLAENREAAHRLFDSLQRYRKLADGGGEDFATAEDMARKLGDTLNLLPDDAHDHTAEIINLFNGKVLHGLGDYYSTSDIEIARNGIQLYRKMLSDIDQHRTPGPVSKDSEDERFHKEMDAWIVTISRKLHNVRDHETLTFVGPTTLRQIYKGSIDQYSRNVLVPYALLKAFDQADPAKDVRREVDARLRKSLERVKAAIADLRGAETFDDLASCEIDEVISAREQLAAWLYSKDDPERRRQLQRERMDRIMKTPNHLRDNCKRAGEEMKERAKKVVDLAPQLLNDDLLEAYELDKNPRLQMVYRKLGLR